MRDVVIVGGGLTGLSVAYALSSYELDVTLIEVKRHLGGSIQSTKQDEIVFDSGAFALADTLEEVWLADLGLDDALFSLGEHTVAFKQGTGQLIDALAQKMTATRLMRMAVSSIGELDSSKRFSICMENGLMFDARALVLAVPARYAERMFYGYITPITEQLLDYHYDTIQRVSLVCKTDDLPATLNTPPDMGFPFIHRTTHPARVPTGHTLLQFGIRIAPTQYETQTQLIDFVREAYDLPEPIASHIGFWAEADPLSCYDEQHEDWINTIQGQLPDGIALIGSDYLPQPFSEAGVVDLNQRIQQGIIVAEQVVSWIESIN
ncbi:MAG: FAD-dependent oxidoreductase [Chloroflexota bacterium]